MDLLTRAARAGIHTEFVDAHGQRRRTDPVALERIVSAMPERPSYRLIDAPVVVRSDRQDCIMLRDAVTFPVTWEIVAGLKVIARGKAADRAIRWSPGLPVGSYRLRLASADASSEEVPLLIAPPGAFAGEFDRSWLLAVQLYSVTSSRNWGIGDFTDLDALLECAAELGAGGVGLNPLHALFDDRPGDCSPYSPNSRLFLNGLYIDVEKLPEFAATAVDPEALRDVRQRDLVDYATVSALKWKALRAAFAAFRAKATPERKQAFDAFRGERGSLLARFACFEVLRHRFNVPWWEWPEEWRSPEDARCASLRAGPDGVEIEFIEFVQWVADHQLRSCRDHARRLGMKLGLYLDVAVGVQADGFDAWNEQGAISRHLAVGAPPDILNTAGQNWGLAGFNAAGLEAECYQPFRDMLVASMRHAGAIRLDHVLGLQRLYLIPHGLAADHGAYVQMPFAALLAVIAQESIAYRCVVIGEDLGTVPEGFREQLAAWGIWSYLVMMFERDDQGSFRGVDHYAANALVTFNTHDLSTYAGWRNFGDLALKRSLGIDPGESDDDRWHALTMLTNVLRHHGIDNHDLYAMVRFLSHTRSRLLAISLEDLLGVIEQPNIPGTVDEHPNWRRRLPVPVEEIAGAVDFAALKDATRERTQQRRPDIQ